MSTPAGPIRGDNEASAAIDLAVQADFSLGQVRVKPSAREFVHANGVEVLEPRVMQVLVALARQAGSVVSRDQLIEQCWAGRVVGEDAIQRCMTKIRRLAETHGGFSLDTIARVGYRLTALSPAPTVTAAPSPTVAVPRARHRVLASGLAVLGIALTAALTFGVIQWRAAREAQARLDLAMTQIETYISEDQLGAAFTLAHPLSQRQQARANPRFAELWQQIAKPMRPLIAEPGAAVYFKAYEAQNAEWILAGTSPIEQWIDAPRTTLRMKVTKPGFRTGYFTVAVPGPSVESQRPYLFDNMPMEPIPLPLIAESSPVPDNMVLVPRTDVPVYLAGWIPQLFGAERYDIPAFAIGRSEVTNREFKEFIDAGGYEKEQYWTGLAFMEQGRALSWSEARARFVDATHRHGPADWQLSAYPNEQGDMPVRGVSWYEATAYARFRGQSLPTIHHWMRAAFSPISAVFSTTPAIATASRFNAGGPVSALREAGLGPWGTYSMLGNVREWVTNFSGNDAIALGSSWTEFAQNSTSVYTSDPMRRAPDHGFRLMQTLAESPNEPALLEPIRLTRDSETLKRAPVSDDAFEAMRFQYPTAKVAPIEVIKRELQRSELYSVEEVVLKFASEIPTTLHVIRPVTKSDRPLQAIIFGPGGNCCFAKRANLDNLENLRDVDFIVSGGRIVVLPIWAGSYERVTATPLDMQQQLDRGRRAALAWHHDLTSTLDYLESQRDIDHANLGYLGYSGGATYMGVLLAIETRIKTAVFYSGGIPSSGAVHPMIDIVNYAPRITLPLLMLNGRYDHHHPLEKSQNRLFDLLGTPPDQKQHLVYDTGHFSYRRNTFVTETSNWFDRYLGPVREAEYSAAGPRRSGNSHN